MRDLSDGLAFSNFARLMWKENILSTLIFGKKLKKEKDSFSDLSVLTCTDYMTMYEAFIKLNCPTEFNFINVTHLKRLNAKMVFSS